MQAIIANIANFLYLRKSLNENNVKFNWLENNWKK